MATLRRLATYLGPYKGLLVLLFACMLGGLAANLTVPRVLSFVIDRGIAARSMSAVVLYAGLLALVSAARAG
ncbi:MAG: ABC transporter ATP-binding protein, partial [Chloroflexi bacterium]|nr:ABC transporter ATP-binding protein [Chloroflexota bacterium]